MDPHINPATGVWDDNYYASTQNKGGGGGGGADTKAYDTLLSSMPKATDFAAGLNAKEDSAFSDYLSYISSQASPLDFYKKASEAQGIPELRKTQSTLQGTIYDLEDTLRRVEPDVSATSRNSIVTDAQRRGIVTAKQAPIIENLGWQSQSLGRVSSAISEADRQALQLTDLNEQGVNRTTDVYKTRMEQISDQNARAMTGFTTDMQNTLSISMAKIARNEQLSDEEARKAFELLKMEKQFQFEKDNMQKSTDVIEVGGRLKLIDKQTGQTIQDLGAAKSTGGTGMSVNTAISTPKPTSSPSSSPAGSSGGFKPMNLLEYNAWMDTKK